jgi:hypothetical protein
LPAGLVAVPSSAMASSSLRRWPIGGHPEGLQVLGGQFRQDIGVDLVVPERLIIEARGS